MKKMLPTLTIVLGLGLLCGNSTAQDKKDQKSTRNSITFANGTRVERQGPNLIVTDSSGRHLIPHLAPGGKPPSHTPSIYCEGAAAWLGSHKANTPRWRKLCWDYFELCLGGD